MFMLKVIVYNRHYDGDKSYHVDNVLIYDYQLGNWLAKPKTKDYELLSYQHCH